MREERFNEIKSQIKQSFDILDEYQEDLDPGEAEVLEFDGPNGKMMVKYVTRPKMLDKKTSYSNRPGSAVQVDYVFSEDEFVSHLEVYSWSDQKGDWQKVEADALF